MRTIWVKPGYKLQIKVTEAIVKQKRSRSASFTSHRSRPRHGLGEEIEVKMVQIATSTRGTDEEQDPRKPHHARVRNCDPRTSLHQLIKQISGLSMQSTHVNGDAGDLAADSFPI